MSVVKVRDKQKLLRFFEDDRFLHIYEIGDLDDFFWSHSEWYGLEVNQLITSVLLIYKGTELPVLLALENKNIEAAKELLLAVVPELPSKIYCHLSPGFQAPFAEAFALESHDLHDKMSLVSAKYLNFLHSDELQVRRLACGDKETVSKLYQDSYPDNWFDERMLLTGKYFGGFLGNQLISVAGIHVYSKEFGVAALGNITTATEFRGKGYAKVVTAHLCKDLTKELQTVGLNVNSDNLAAITAYL